MTLQCECGGALEITAQIYDRDESGRITGKGRAHETYKCASCGRTGTYAFGDGPERTSGCVVVA